MKQLLTFFRLCREDQNLFIESVFWLAIASIAASSYIPFRKTARYLGHYMEQTPMVETEHKEELRRVSKTIYVASRKVPWECRCLAQGIAGKKILAHRNIESTLYFGVAKDENDKLLAHAWLRSGTEIITGSDEKDRFTVVSFFS